jgi:outer membrane receptor protein involved in Fe transport
VVGLCATVSLTPFLQAQDVENEEEVFDLSPFSVVAADDDGWTSGTTLSATRTRQSIRDLSISIDAVTAEYLDDVGAYDLDEASSWIAGLDTVAQLDQGTDEGRTSYRGLELGDRDNAQSSRNLFTWYPRTDSYNIERIDFNKGSNSLMFGDTSPGGLPAVYTKRAQNRNFGEVDARIDSNDGYRVTLDLNRVITDNFYLRLNMVDRDQRDYVDRASDQLSAYSLAATYRPFQNTIIRAEYEDMSFKRKRGISGLEVDQRAALGRGFSSSSRQLYTSFGEYYDPETRLYYAPDGQGGFLEPVDIERNDRRRGAGGDNLPLAGGLVGVVHEREDDEPFWTVGPLPIEINTSDRNTDRPVENVSLWIEQAVGDLTMELAFNRQDQEQSWKGGSYDDTLGLDSEGRVFTDEDFSRSQFGNVVNNARLTAAYPVRTKWFNQYLVATVSYMDDEASSFRQRLVNKAVAYDPDTGEYDPTVNLVDDHRIRSMIYIEADDYSEDLGSALRNIDDIIRENRPANMPYVPGIFEPIWVEYTTENRPYIDKRYTRTMSLSSSGTLFNDRLTTLLGVRYDAFQLKRYILPDGSREDLVDEYGIQAWFGQDVFVGDPDEAPEQYEYLPVFDVDDTTFSSGASYRLFDNLNVYANYSTSFRWQGTENFLGEVLGPQTGKTSEVGFKGEFLKRNLTVSAALFQVDRENVAFRFSSGNNADELELLFNDGEIQIDPDGTMNFIPASPGDPGFVEIARGLNSEHRQVTASEISEGFEMTVSTRRIGGFRFRVAVSYIEIESERDLSKYIPLVALAEQRAAERAPIIEANWPNDPLYDPEELPEFEDDLRDSLEDAQEVIEFNSGTGFITGSRSRPWRVKYNIDYEFPDDTFLEGLRVLISGRWSDDYLISTNDDVLWVGGSTHPIDVALFYDTELAGFDTRFFLRVRDVVDLANRDDIRERSGFVDRFTDELRWRYRNIDPTSWEFGVRVKF